MTTNTSDPSKSHFPPDALNLNRSKELQDISQSLIKPNKMCFDIDVVNYPMQSLCETLERISMLLTKPVVVDRLPDKGYQLRQAKLKLEKEIKFREELYKTADKMHKLELKCASETDLAIAHVVRLCSLERKPERERFRPNMALRNIPSGRTESMGELRRGVMPLDLATSLSLQRDQEKRIKAEQMRAKQDRLKNAVKVKEKKSSNSDSSPNHSGDSEDELIEVFNGVTDGEELQKAVKNYVFNGNGKAKDNDQDKPGPSGIKMVKQELKGAAANDVEMPGPSGIKHDKIPEEEDKASSNEEDN